MHPILKDILEEKRREIDEIKRGPGLAEIDQGNLPERDFRGAISGGKAIRLIAEIKFASPSAGRLREKSDPLTIGKDYEEAGAAAVSLLTDKRFFSGDLEHLPRLKKTITLPLLRKDFILDEVQVRESLLYGADALLLMVRILSPEELRDLIALCHELGIAPLTEVHDRVELETALKCGAEIIGINNRDFNTFDVTLDTTLKLASIVPAGCTLISESGIESGADIKKLSQCGVEAVLVGSALMRSKDLMGKTRELVQAGRDNHAQR